MTLAKILIVGLGNPGKKYEQTRHNAGFLAIDALREKLEFPEWNEKKKQEALVSEGVIGESTIILAKPLTFMNLSGQAVVSLKKTYGIENSNLWCIYDDIDLPLGTVRIRTEGSAGTHNGMRSVVASLGSNDIPRVRIGIETRTNRLEEDLTDFVLKKPGGDEKKQFLQICREEVPEKMITQLKATS